jgi:ABC-type iron transport system FetAB permease component
MCPHVTSRSPMDNPSQTTTHLSWANVGLAFSFILFDAAISFLVGLRVGRSLVTAAIRCVAQLAVVGLLLQSILETNNPWAVAGIAGTRRGVAASLLYRSVRLTWSRQLS